MAKYTIVSYQIRPSASRDKILRVVTLDKPILTNKPPRHKMLKGGRYLIPIFFIEDNNG